MSTKAVLNILRAQRPSYKNDVEKLVILVNAIFMNEGFKLLQVGQEITQEQATGEEQEISTSGWNSQDGFYNFKYTSIEDSQYKKGLILRAIPMQDTILNLDLENLEDVNNKMSTVDLRISDYVIPEKSDITQSFQNIDKLDRNIKLGLGVFGEQSKEKLGNENQKQQFQQDINKAKADPVRYRETYPVPPGFHPLDKHQTPGVEDVHSVVGPNHPFFKQKFPNASKDRLRDPTYIKPPGARYDPVNPPGMPGFTPESLGQDYGEGWNDLGPPPGMPFPGRGGGGQGPGGFGGSGFDFI